MLCEDCQEREAELQLTAIIDGEMRTLELCAACASARGLSASSPTTAPLADFLAQLGPPGRRRRRGFRGALSVLRDHRAASSGGPAGSAARSATRISSPSSAGSSGGSTAPRSMSASST